MANVGNIKNMKSIIWKK